MKKIYFLFLLLFLVGCKAEKDNAGNIKVFQIDQNQTILVPPKPDKLTPEIDSFLLTIEDNNSRILSSYRTNNEIMIGYTMRPEKEIGDYFANFNLKEIDAINIASIEAVVSGKKIMSPCHQSNCGLDISIFLVEKVCDNGEHFITFNPDLDLSLFLNKKDSTQQQIDLKFEPICNSVQVSTNKTVSQNRGLASVSSGTNNSILYLLFIIVIFVFSGFFYRLKKRRRTE